MMVLQIAVMLGYPSRERLMQDITFEQLKELEALIALDMWPKGLI